MIRKKRGDIEWLEFELLVEEKDLTHGVFLRHGGKSRGSYSSLNMAGKHDDDSAVEKNRALLVETIGVQRLVLTNQVHGSDVMWVKENQEILDCDGLITDRTDWGLLMMHADCQVAIFYDPIHKIVANVHAGWRGMVKEIYQNTVGKMRQLFGSKAEDLLVAISPSLGPENSEFKHFKDELPESFWPFQIKPTYFDLWAIAEHQLTGCGVLPHHIQIAKMDTYANREDFFSYRRQKAGGDEATGCHGTIVALKRREV